MRFLVEITTDGDDRVAGEVTPDGGPSLAFSGWLELMRLLEDAMQATDDRQET